MLNKADTLRQCGLSPEQLDAHWLPFTGNRQFKESPRLIVGAKGHYYTDVEGRQIFDGLSGLWTCGAGHAHPKICEAITTQVKTLDYCPAFQFSHPKSFELAAKITEWMPQELNRVFFTGSGSEAVETALKMARAYWRNKGQGTKTRFIGRIKGYHGVNFGGISVGGIAPNKTPYGPLLDAIHLPHTLIKDNAFSQGLPEQGVHLADNLKDLITLHDASNIAAVIIEPVAGSAGVIPPPKGYLQRLRQICDEYDILLIFDEVITAFGRLGARTAAEEFGVTPDVMTIAKQLTNGAAPMGGVLANSSIYDAFMDNAKTSHQIEFPHGYTYSAHPLACAAGLACLDLLKEEQLIERARTMAPLFAEMLHSLKRCQYVTDIRNYGLAGALTLETADGDPTLRPFKVAMSCWQKGFYVRNGGDTIQLGLPFGVEVGEIERLINALGESIDELG